MHAHRHTQRCMHTHRDTDGHRHRRTQTQTAVSDVRYNVVVLPLTQCNVYSTKHSTLKPASTHHSLYNLQCNYAGDVYQNHQIILTAQGAKICELPVIIIIIIIDNNAKHNQWNY